MMRGKSAGVCALLVFASASSCRRPQVAPASPAPAVNADSVADSVAAASARRAEAARRDSIARAAAARADAVRRDSVTRADAARRAEAGAADARAVLARPVYFDFEDDAVRADGSAALDAKVPLLRAHADTRIRIEGHADDRGSDEYNLALGQRRAAAARRYLVARGIDGARIDVTSFGEQRPICRRDEESCWQENRRDEFVISAGSLWPRPRPR